MESPLNCLYIQDTVVVELHKGVIEYKVCNRGKMITQVSTYLGNINRSLMEHKLTGKCNITIKYIGR